MRELSLFTGVGGGVLGSKLLGWKTVGYVEFNAYCQRVIKQRIKDGIFDNAPIFGDIRAFTSEGYAARYRGLVDAITGGFPCQPFSVAGKQLAENDERNMWPQTAECVRIIRPRIVYFENVTGLLSTGYFEQILCDLYKMGYTVRWCTLSAAETGAPHQRERLWIFSYTESEHDREHNSGKSERQVQQLGECSIKTSVSDTDRKRYERSYKTIRPESKMSVEKEPFNLRCALSNSTEQGLEGKITASGEWKHDGLSTECSWWSVEPGMGRVANGMANRTHRLKAIGNGQVPITMATAFQILSEGIV
jgi:DNA (cytosine-5)-methyltransferase 1